MLLSRKGTTKGAPTKEGADLIHVMQLFDYEAQRLAAVPHPPQDEHHLPGEPSGLARLVRLFEGVETAAAQKGQQEPLVVVRV